MNYNKVILVGRLTAVPELRQTGGGTSVTNFTLAVDRKYSRGSEKQTDFLSIVAWRQTAEFICQYFTKGNAILIEGELQTRSWTDSQGNKRYATEVVADEARFCEANRENREAIAPNAVQGQNFGSVMCNTGIYPDPNFEELMSDDDLPF